MYDADAPVGCSEGSNRLRSEKKALKREEGSEAEQDKGSGAGPRLRSKTYAPGRAPGRELVAPCQNGCRCSRIVPRPHPSTCKMPFSLKTQPTKEVHQRTTKSNR